MRNRLAVAWAALALTGCDLAYPEVVIVNQAAAGVQLRNVSFSGQVWSTVLGHGDATAVGSCLPGADRIHFEKLDPGAAVWFPYQTLSEHQVRYGEFHLLEVREGDLEQDFSAPGPYGH